MSRIPRTPSRRERDQWRLQDFLGFLKFLDAGKLVTFNGSDLISVDDLTDFISGTDDQIIITFRS